LPFGEELFAGTGGRTTGQGYTGDNIRQKFTSQERDNETGLDYFLARYYSSSQGRFTSVDPFNIALDTQVAAELNPERARALFNAYLSQPQQWNRYAYAINNPLLYVDPTGESIQLSNDKDERERQLQALREAVGAEAGAYLYANQGEDGNYYVGIYEGGPNGNGPTFEQVNEVAGEIGAVIRDTQVLTLELVRPGTVTDDFGDSQYIGAAGRASLKPGGPSPGVTGIFNGRLTIKMLDWGKKTWWGSNYDLGYLPGVLMNDGKDNMMTPSVMLGHEIAHGRARMTGEKDSRGAAVRLENKIRKLQYPNGPQRKTH